MNNIENSKREYRFSYFTPPITNTIPQEDPLTLTQTFDLIRGGRLEDSTEKIRHAATKEDRKSLKGKVLPYAIFTGTFSRRNDKALIERSGLFCCDLDHVGNDQEELKRALIEKARPAIMFRSPSGDGLKVVFAIKVEEGQHLEYYTALKNFFDREFNISEPVEGVDKPDFDTAHRAISLACFLCHDPDVFYSEDPLILERSFIDEYSDIEPPATDEEKPPNGVPRGNRLSTFDDYCQRSNVGSLLETHGWAMVGQRGNRTYYKRPGEGASPIGGNVQNNIFYCFTSSTAFESHKAYNCAQVYATLECNGDLSEAARRLYETGYGDRYQPSGKQVPGTIFISEHEFAKDIFTFVINKKGVKLSGMYRAGVINELASRGYAKRYNSNNTYVFIREKANILDEVEPSQMKDDIFEAIHSRYSGPLEFLYGNLSVTVQATKFHETFLRSSHLLFNDKFLEHLPTHAKPILKDTSTEAFFPFANMVVKVTKDAITQIDYKDLTDICIWRQHILPRPYTPVEEQGCHFDEFMANVTSDEPDRLQAFVSAIGYLLHNFSHQSKGQAVIAYDEEITDLKNPMGGTGKGILKQAIAQLRSVVKIDGKKFDESDRFCFQDVDDRTQVVFFDDVKADLGFDRFNSILTEGWNIEKKMKQSFFIKPEDSPKVYITSNAIIKGEGTTIKRRQFIIEFAPFYSNLVNMNLEPIKHIHGCEFFGADWSESEWYAFYAYMLECVRFYLCEGLIHYKYKSLNANTLRQNTSDEFWEWISEHDLKVSTQYDVRELFNDFKETFYGEHSEFSLRTFNKWLKIYAKCNGLELKIKRSNSISTMKLEQIRHKGT